MGSRCRGTPACLKRGVRERAGSGERTNPGTGRPQSSGIWWSLDAAMIKGPPSFWRGAEEMNPCCGGSVSLPAARMRGRRPQAAAGRLAPWTHCFKWAGSPRVEGSQGKGRSRLSGLEPDARCRSCFQASRSVFYHEVGGVWRGEEPRLRGSQNRPEHFSHQEKRGRQGGGHRGEVDGVHVSTPGTSWPCSP